MKKVLIFFTSFARNSGSHRALLNLLYALPKDRYSIDLVLYDDLGYMFGLLPKEITVLPFLKQLSKCTPELLGELRAEGKNHIADVREAVHKRARNPEYLKLSPVEQKLRAWESLIETCPRYDGYDIAVAFSGGGITLKIVAEKTDAKKKMTFIHTDIRSHMNYIGRARTEAECAYPLWRQIDTIAVFTEQNKASFSAQFPDLAPKVTVLPNISTSELFRLESVKFHPAEFGSESFNIFTSARLMKFKGLDFIYEASRILFERGINFRWVVAGICEDDFALELLKAHPQSDIRDVLIFKNNMGNPFPYYKHCDLYVQPSRYEGRCLSLEEAKILDCAILATDYPSVRDVITDGVNGIICGMDARSLAEGISTLYKNKPLRESLANANRPYTGDEGIEEYINLLG